MMRGREHRLVLDGGDGDEHRPPRCRGGQRRADDGEVVGLGAAGGEHHLVRLGAHRRRDCRGAPAPGRRARRGRTDGSWTGFPKLTLPRKGSMASSTSGRTGVVAAWSR